MNVDDVVFLKTLIDLFREQYSAIKKVVVLGISNGGFMTWKILREFGHTTLVDLYVPIVGLQPVWAEGPALPKLNPTVKVFMVVGTKDHFVPICGGTVGRPLRSDKSLRGEGLEEWEYKREEERKEGFGECCSLEQSIQTLCEAISLTSFPAPLSSSTASAPPVFKTKDRIVPQSELIVVKGVGEALEIHETEYIPSQEKSTLTPSTIRVWVVKEMGHTFPGANTLLLSLVGGKIASCNMAAEIMKFLPCV